MKYKLVIAEKPSVAQSIAKVIGATERKDGYLSTPNRVNSDADDADSEYVSYLVSWCYGHLIELAAPEIYDPKYEKWRKDDLPIFPDPFQYQVQTAQRSSSRS